MTNAERQKRYRDRKRAAPSSRWYRRSGYIYLIRASGTDFYKIGISRNDVASRAKELQIGCPLDLYISSYAPVMNAEETEAAIHEWIKHRNKRGEWFVLDVDCICRIRDLLVIEENYYESKLVWLASHGAVDLTGMVRGRYTEHDPYEVQAGAKIMRIANRVPLPGDWDYKKGS